MTKRILPDPELLKQLIDYNPETGVLLWLDRTYSSFAAGRYSREATGKAWNTRYAGSPALAHANNEGYLMGNLYGRRVSSHRVAWAIYYGEWPQEGVEIDHINGVKSDNRICNLRIATRCENRQNIGIQKNNTSGAKGVSWSKCNGSWRVRVMVGKKSRHIGYYADFEEAIQARQDAADKLHGEFVRHE